MQSSVFINLIFSKLFQMRMSGVFFFFLQPQWEQIIYMSSPRCFVFSIYVLPYLFSEVLELLLIYLFLNFPPSFLVLKYTFLNNFILIISRFIISYIYEQFEIGYWLFIMSYFILSVRYGQNRPLFFKNIDQLFPD